MSLHELIKSINKQIINPQVIVDFYKHFSNVLSPILLDVYDSWEKLGTMGAISRTGIISTIYEFKLKNLHCNPQEKYAKNLTCNNR